MTRWITLILFSVGVIHASGIVLPSSMGDNCATLCGSHTTPQIAPQVVPEPSCCPSGSEDIRPQVDISEKDQSDAYCPMSNGPCTCGLNPVNDHTPDEPMPAPQRDRETLQMVRGPSRIIQLINIETLELSMPVAQTGTILWGFSHNQVQAFLGVWRR